MRPNELAFYENYIASHPASAYLPKLAAIYLHNDELDLAIDCCQKELTARPYSPYGQFLWGLVALKRNDVALAIEKFQAAIQCDPNFLAAYYQLLAVGENYLSAETYQQYLLKLKTLNPLDRALAQRSAPQPQATQPAPAPAEPTIPEPMALDEFPTAEQEPPAPPLLAEEEAHLGPLEAEFPQEAEPTTFEAPLEPASAPIGGAPSSLTELFQKFKTQSIDELQQETIAPPSPAAPSVPTEPTAASAPEPTPAAADSSEPPSPAAGDISKLFEKLKTTPLDELQAETWAFQPPSDETVTPPEPTPPSSATAAASEPTPPSPTAPEQTTPAAAPKKGTSRKKKETKGDTENSGGEITIKFPIPTWTLVEVLKKQQLYNQALEIITIIEKKSQKPSDLEKARQTRAEIEKLMATE